MVAGLAGSAKDVEPAFLVAGSLILQRPVQHGGDGDAAGAVGATADHERQPGELPQTPAVDVCGPLFGMYARYVEYLGAQVVAVARKETLVEIERGGAPVPEALVVEPVQYGIRVECLIEDVRTDQAKHQLSPEERTSWLTEKTSSFEAADHDFLSMVKDIVTDERYRRIE